MRYLLALSLCIMAGTISATCQEGAPPAGADSKPSASATSSPDPASSLHERYPRYQLRRGDSFDLTFEFSPEFNQTVGIQPDGYVTLKGAGTVYVEGQTVPQLTETLKTAYSKILHDPVISVALKDFEKPYFIASGEVSKPGKYDLRSDLTVTEAVAIAGGFNEKSKHSQVVLFRPVASGGYETKLLNIKKLLATRNLSEDVRLQPGDLLYVPQNAFSKIRSFLPTSSLSAYLGSGIL